MKPQSEFAIDAMGSLQLATQRDQLSPAGRLADNTSSPLLQRSGFYPSIWMGAVLVIGGLFHFVLLWITSADWNGPLSPRKPGLFGVSAGLTVWSIAWVMTKIYPRNHDHYFANVMSAGLLLEVGLITIQYWRGVPSHFNHGNSVDAAIEITMLGVILIVTLGIFSLAWRSRRLQPMDDALAIAIRSGLWLLVASCVLGVMVTIAGELNIANGSSPEIWGRAGVLKYPHGAALHAIQVLPILYGLMKWLRVPNAAWLMRTAVAAHVLFMSHALWQTLRGRERLDVDLVGGITLAAAGLLILVPAFAIAYRLIWIDRNAS